VTTGPDADGWAGWDGVGAFDSAARRSRPWDLSNIREWSESSWSPNGSSTLEQRASRISKLMSETLFYNFKYVGVSRADTDTASKNSLV